MAGAVVDLDERRTARRVSWHCPIAGCGSEGMSADRGTAALDGAAHHAAVHDGAHVEPAVSGDEQLIRTRTERGRDGDLVDVDDRTHDERCVDGWLGYDVQGRLVACTVCRPHLSRRRIPKSNAAVRHDPLLTDPDDLPSKARRLLAEGRVHVLFVTPRRVVAVVHGRTGLYDVAKVGTSTSSCTCPARGACSHALAVDLITPIVGRQPS